MSETYSIPISNGILAPAHCKSIGAAIWVFLWMIDHTTKEVAGGDGDLDGLVFGGLPVRASVIARELGIAPRTIHEHIDRLRRHGYLRRIDGGEGMPAGYAVQKSKKWKRNKAATMNQALPTLAEIREPSQESANLPRGFTVDPRGNPPDPRGNPLPIRKTLQDKAEQEILPLPSGSSESVPQKRSRGASKAPEADVARVYQAYPRKESPAEAYKAIEKAIVTLKARGESNPAEFLISKIAAWERSRGRDRVAGNFVPSHKYPATWFNKGCYDLDYGASAAASSVSSRYVDPAKAYSGPEYSDAPTVPLVVDRPAIRTSEAVA